MKNLIKISCVLLVFSLLAVGSSKSEKKDDASITNEYESQFEFESNTYYSNEYHSSDEKDEADTKINKEISSSINFFNLNQFTGGAAWLCYSDDTTDSRYILINSSGKVVFKQTSQQLRPKNFSGGIGYYIDENDDYFLMNSTGKIIGSSVNGNFDSVLAYGDGMALVYKNEGNVSISKNMYAVIDKNGNYVSEYSDWGFEPSASAYLGDGMFIVQTVVYDSSSNQKFYVYSSNAKNEIKYYYGKAYIDNEWSYYKVSRNQDNLYSEGNVSHQFFRLDKKGNVQAVDRFDYATDGMLVVQNHIDEYVTVTDCKTNQTYQITEYGSGQVGYVPPTGLTTKEKNEFAVMYNGDYGVIMIIGKDGKQYFTLINRKGEVQFDPILCENAKYSEGIIVIKNNDGTHSLANEKGEIYLNGLNYKEVTPFENGVARAKNYNDKYCYINTKGQIINITF